MNPVRDPFEIILEDFKRHLTAKEEKDFQFVTLNDVRETALRIQKDQELLKTMMNMSRLESFLEAMAQFGKVIEVFANANVFVAFIWGPLKFILQTASTFTDVFESILDAYNQIGEHMPLLEQYTALFGARPHMRRVLALIYTDILKFHKKAVRLFRGKTNVWRQLFRSIWKDFETQFKSILEGLSSHRRLIVEQAELLHFEESQSHSQAVLTHIQQYEQDRSETLKRLKKEEEEESHRKYLAVLSWFSAAQSTISDHENFRRTRSPYTGTGEWILKHEKVQNWREMDIPVSSILWLNGIPGAGKTILASVIIDSCLQDVSRNTCYFYCNEDDPNRNNSISIFKGLLSQLLNQCRDLIPYCYGKYLSSGEVSLTSSALAEQLLRLFFEIIPKQSIIIDGLDECNPAQRKLVLTFFTSMVDRCDEQESGKLRVLFVSQDFSDIGKAFQTATVLKLAPEDNKNDIKTYTYDWSKKIGQKYSLNTKQVEFIQESTMIRSQGMFLFAKLVMGNLYAQETQRNLLQEIETYTFPKELEDAYERILLRLERSLSQTQWIIVRKLLGWMICAKRPLKWREIQGAVSIDPDDQRFDFDGRRLRSNVEEYCGSLVKILSGDRVELVHTTAKICISRSGYIRASVVECNLTSLCLRYLTFECFDKDLIADDLQYFVIEGYLSFQDYATAKWLQHIRAVIKTPITEFLTDLESQTALQELQVGLDEFSTRYKQEILNIPISQAAKEDCEIFTSYPFYANLLNVWNHVYQHESKGLEVRNEISLKSLSNAVSRNRTALENLSSSSHAHVEDIHNFYGDKNFKCPRVTCFYFHEGFKDAKLQTTHRNRHDRPFNCPVADCSIVEFGFSSNKDLEKHKKMFHPEIADQGILFNIQSKVTAATPWSCQLCGKTFTRGFHQRSHMMSHQGLRPHKCDECGKAFTRNNDRKRHEKLHTRR